MQKVAFLNLTYNSFNRNDLWDKFFKSGDKDSFNLYIHPKSKEENIFSDFFIENTVETDWGQFSLVEATIELMKAALQDEENEYFSLVSHAHLPLYDLDTTVSLIKKSYKNTTFAKHFSFFTKVKSQLVLREGVINHPFDQYNAVCQFFLCRRKEVEAFVESFEEYSRYFVKNKVIFADEFYFWAVARELKMNFKIGQATTYSDWSIRRGSGNKIERNPRWFHKFDDHMLNRYRESNFIYVRKIEENTIIDTDPFQDQKKLDSSLKDFKIYLEDEQFSRTIGPLRK